MTPTVTQNEMPIFSNLTYSYQGGKPGKNVVFKIQNRPLSAYEPINGQANLYFVDPGKNSIEITVSGTTMQDSVVSYDLDFKNQ